MRAASSSHDDLPERSSRILAALVQQFIDCGEPVSSLWLAEHGGFGCSSATVRGVMAKLEERGYVHQPHTLVGCVPTDLGYRAYVDLLLHERNTSVAEPEIEARLRQAGSMTDVLSNVSYELSRASHQLSFAMMPPTDDTLRHIEFVPLEGARILVVVETSREVSHKVIDIGMPVEPSELAQGAAYLNQELAGLPLWCVRAAVVEQLREQRMLYDELLSRALRLASSTLEDVVPVTHLFLEGTGFFLDDLSDADDEASFSTLRVLLSMIERKDQLVRLLNEYIDGRGLTVVIGTEHVSPEMRDFSLVISTYEGGERTGGVGVIGPRRMRYSHAIAAVDRISRAVSRVLVDQGPHQTSHDRRPQDRSA